MARTPLRDRIAKQQPEPEQKQPAWRRWTQEHGHAKDTSNVG